MRIHWLQHVPFEGLGLIEEWLDCRGFSAGHTRLFAGDPLPSVEEFDMLIVMGGPMGVEDEAEYPWLAAEKQLIRESIAVEKVILGVCLGAQLLADGLGAAVRANEEKEIGWFSINRVTEVKEPLASMLPAHLQVLHWHGDTFDIPEGAVPLYSSQACTNQAFLAAERMLGLQFHLEIGRNELKDLLANCASELVPGPWVQNRPDLLAGAAGSGGCAALLSDLLDYLCSRMEFSS